jgi:hypothetical protein
MTEQPHETLRLTTYAEQLEIEARQRWAAGAAEAARQRRERHQEQLRIARVSMWGEYRSEDNG